MSLESRTPPSAEGLRHPAEIERAFSTASATLQVAFERGDEEMFRRGLLIAKSAFIGAMEELELATTRSTH